MFIEYWEGLSLFMKVIWGVALTSTLVFVIQTILSFIGADYVDDVDTPIMQDPTIGDIHDSGMNLYTFRNLINFALGFSWTIIICNNTITSRTLLIGVAVVVGVALVVAVMYLFRWLSTMQQSGNINVLQQAKGCSGVVYLVIPQGGVGKVQITINGAIREYDAITNGVALPTGTPIKVVGVVNSETLIVDKL